MPEIYSIQVENNRLHFAPLDAAVPDCILNPTNFAAKVEAGIEIICRMGDPDLLHCIVYKQDKNNGGIFAIHSKSSLLFVAFAENELIFALAQGFFGQLVANVRYGVDIFENLELADD